MAASSGPQGVAPGLARKVNKILELKTESPELVAAMTTMSTFYQDNNSAERRSLRTKVETRSTLLNQEYLSAASSVIKVLDMVQRDLEGLKDGCRLSKEALASAQGSTSALLNDTDRLHRETAASEKRSELVQKFLQQYQLSSTEIAALEASEISEDFFKALAKVRSIHGNCKSLLKTHHQRAGLEIMDAMSAHQEAAYERLCRWVQRECRSLGEQEAPEVTTMLQQATQALRERPVLFKYCATEVATARHNILFQRFIGALTRGGPGGMPRPIEMHAHDPRRYLGDMLAWVHQSLASERELLIGLFGDDSSQPLKNETSGNSRISISSDAGPARDILKTSALLDRVFDSICRPVKVRIEQVLMATPPLLLCFSLSQLLGFYTSLVDRLLGDSASLTQTLASCRQLASRIFREQLQVGGERLMRYLPQPPGDLSPPPQLVEALQQLSEIISSFEASYEAGEGGSGETEFSPILATGMDPLVEVINRSSEALSTNAPTRVDEGAVDPSAQSIYIINCLSALEYTIIGHPSCAARAQQLQKQISKQVSVLVSGQAGQVLGASGLAEIADRMRIYTSGRSGIEESMTADQALSVDRIVHALNSFITILTQPQAQPEFRTLQVPKIRAVAVSQVAATLADTYELVYDSLHNPESCYDSQSIAASDLKHTPKQVRTILGIL